MVDTDERPIYDYKHGRWLCSDVGLAYDCARDHAGDSVYLYDRDKDGKMVNIREYWSPKKDNTKPSTVVNGRLRTNQ